MKKYTVLLTLIAIFVLFCACGNTVSDDVTPTPTAIATPTQTSTPTLTPTFKPIFTAPTSALTPTSTPIPFHQTFESFVFDGEYTHEKIIELVTDFAIASDNEIFTLRQEYFPDSNNLDVKNFGWHYFTEDNLFKLFIYRQGLLYSQNSRGQFVIPVKDVIDFLVDRHFCDPVTVNEKEFFSPLLPLKRFVFDPTLVTIADYDKEKNVLILDNIPSINITPFAYNVKLLTDIHSSVKNSSLCFFGTYMDENQEEKEFHFSIGTDCKKNKENLPEIMWIVFRSYSWCGHTYS
ncbi:MAG: hypothetical protein E7491_00365 [Ruminococcaceae bacterium]|nr:hypothetical protein [Oscillospiraceae bacterium]